VILVLTDTDRINFLQKLTQDSKYTKRVVLRDSVTGRGWRLHETSIKEGVHDVRTAIDNYYKEVTK